MTLPNQPGVPTRRKVTVPATGTTVTISSSIFCRYVEIVEDNSSTNQGFVATFPDDNFTAQYNFPAGGTLTIGDRSYPRDHAVGLPANMKDPAGNSIPNPVYAKLSSATATATSVEVREYI